MKRMGTVTAMPLRRARRLAVAAGAAAGVVVLAGCADEAPQDTWQPAGDNAQKIQDLQWPVFAIAGLVLLAVATAVTWCVYRYRDRGQPIPKQTHGRPALEIGLTILPAMILIGIAIPTVGTIMALAEDRRHRVRRQRHRPAVVVGDRLPGSGRLPRRGDHRADRHERPARHPRGHERAAAGYEPGRDPQLLGAAHQRQARRRAWAHPDAAPRGRRAGDLRRPVRRVLRTVSRQHADGDRLPHRRRLQDLGGGPTGRLRGPEGGNAGRRGRGRVHPAVRPLPPGQRPGRQRRRAGDRPSRGPGVLRCGAEPHPPDVAEHVRRGDVRPAHSRRAGRRCGTRRRRTFGGLYLEGVTAETLNAPDLRDWIRNAPAKKPMYTDPKELGPTGGLPRGMPYLGLSEDQIDDVIAYLLELN